MKVNYRPGFHMQGTECLLNILLLGREKKDLFHNSALVIELL